MKILEHRPTWIEIDLLQLSKNLQYIKKKAKNKEVWAVVKSDAYMHGLTGVFSTFIANGIRSFCVAQYDEAVTLQKIADFKNESIQILIFGYIDGKLFDNIADNWVITIANMAWYQEVKHIIKHNIRVHIKVDTGMNRRGVKNKNEFTALLEAVLANQFLQVEGVYTHFSSAEEDKAFLVKQCRVFFEIIGDYLSIFKYIHAQNSYGLLQLPMKYEHQFNLVRPGGICYGMMGHEHEIVKPILSLFSRLTDCKTVAAGETIGYGNTYQFEQTGMIGVLPIGYADGWKKSNSNSVCQHINGKLQLVGRICMEQSMVFSSDIVLEINDIIELCGKNQSIFTVAEYNQITDYEFICSLSWRIPRLYKNQKEMRENSV